MVIPAEAMVWYAAPSIETLQVAVAPAQRLVVIVAGVPVHTEIDEVTDIESADPLDGAGFTVIGVVDEVTEQPAAAALLVTLIE